MLNESALLVPLTHVDIVNCNLFTDVSFVIINLLCFFHSDGIHVNSVIFYGGATFCYVAE